MTQSDEDKGGILISLSELKAIYGTKKRSAFKENIKSIKNKLDEILKKDIEPDEIFGKEVDEFLAKSDHPYFLKPLDKEDVEIQDHDYCLPPILNVIIYYTTGDNFF